MHSDNNNDDDDDEQQQWNMHANQTPSIEWPQWEIVDIAEVLIVSAEHRP